MNVKVVTGIKINARVIVTVLFFALTVIGLGRYIDYQARVEEVARNEMQRMLLRTSISEATRSGANWPEQLTILDRPVSLEYTFDTKLTSYIRKLLRRYRSDYSAVVVLDNNTGQILSAVGYEREKRDFTDYLAFSSTHPSASLFKIVTAAELLENEVEKDRRFRFRGKGTTLYRYQLDDKVTRWSRTMSLEKAFVYSNNVVFGKAAIKNISGSGIFQMASNFGFNQDLMNEINLSKSLFKMPQNQYNLAELASGFNRETMISPIHAAVMSSIVANDGMLKYPRLISAATEQTTGKSIEINGQESKQVVNEVIIPSLQDMMEKAVSIGTARGSFRRLSRKYKRTLNIGGKTGTITGGIPHGKRDWFSAYAKPKNSALGSGISVAVMNVNVDKWYVKSAYLAKEIIEYYYGKVNPIDQMVTTNEVKKPEKLEV